MESRVTQLVSGLSVCRENCCAVPQRGDIQTPRPRETTPLGKNFEKLPEELRADTVFDTKHSKENIISPFLGWFGGGPTME